MANYGVELPQEVEIISLISTYSRVWLATQNPTETLDLTDTVENKIERELTETLDLTDGDTYAPIKELTETLDLTDTYARVWLSTSELTETLDLVDSVTYVWVVPRTLTETLDLTDVYTYSLERELEEVISLTEGDSIVEIVQVSPNGGYLVISSVEKTWNAALMEVVKLLEEQGAPKSQTSYLSTYDEANEMFAVAAIVKRH